MCLDRGGGQGNTQHNLTSMMIWKDDAPVRAPLFCSDALLSGGVGGGKRGERGRGGGLGFGVYGLLEQASLAESRGFPHGARHSYSDSPVQVVQERQAVARIARIAPPFQYSILGTGAHPGSLPDRPTCPPSRCVLGRFVKTDKAIANAPCNPRRPLRWREEVPE